MLLSSRCNYVLFYLTILFFYFIPFLANSSEPRYITRSGTPGELWIKLFTPAGSGIEDEYTLQHSMNGGIDWENVELPFNQFDEPCYHTGLNCLTLRVREQPTGWESLVITRDGFDTYELYSGIVHYGLSGYEWLPNSSGFCAFHYPEFSLDTLQTSHEARWQSVDPVYTTLTGGVEKVCLGWAPGDMLNLSHTFDDTAHLFFSTDTAETFHHHSKMYIPNFDRGVKSIHHGYSPGEVYFFNIIDGDIYVSTDTMRTWVIKDIPDFGIYTDRIFEVISGWSPGELFIIRSCLPGTYDPHTALFRTTNFGDTWTCIYSSHGYNSIDDGHGSVLPDYNDLVIWPNPGNGRISFTAPEQSCAIHLYNILGQVVKSTKGFPAHQSGTLTFNELPSGIYFIRIENQNTIDNWVTYTLIK